MNHRTTLATAAFLALGLTAAVPARAQLDNAQADQLMKKAACNACHTVDKKSIGPTYKDVAGKYKGDANAAALLAKKVREGGVGNWGKIPMPPNPAARISDDEIKRLVEWILKR
ncbi:MAG TPA: c-type cytochrome [Burkholderiaceae bacterium]|nr:c-type cytochrome [Burkholderiaceae bacterium]